MYSRLKLDTYRLAVHALLTLVGIGSLYIYTIIVDATSNSEERFNTKNDSTIFLIMSSPLLVIFGMGIYSVILLFIVDDEIDHWRELKE